MSKSAVTILGGDDELLQSFVRVGLQDGDHHHHQTHSASSGGAGGGGSGGGGSSGVDRSGGHSGHHGGPGPTTLSVPHQLSQPKLETHLVRQHSEHFSEVSDNKNAPRKYR